MCDAHVHALSRPKRGREPMPPGARARAAPRWAMVPRTPYHRIFRIHSRGCSVSMHRVASHTVSYPRRSMRSIQRPTPMVTSQASSRRPQPIRDRLQRFAGPLRHRTWQPLTSARLEHLWVRDLCVVYSRTPMTCRAIDRVALRMYASDAFTVSACVVYPRQSTRPPTTASPP